MKGIRALFVLGAVASLLTTLTQAQQFTVEIPEPPVPTVISNGLVSHGDQWHWRRGTNEPQASWNTVADADLDATWSIAPGGFGYGDNAIVGETTRVSPGMQNVHRALYVRRSFVVSEGFDTNAILKLRADYDDGFVAYLDGIEVARRNVSGTPGTPVTPATSTDGDHEASCCNTPNPAEAITLGRAGDLLAPGEHMIAFVGFNGTADSSDFHLIADLYTERSFASNAPVLVSRGLYAWTTNREVTLSGSNTIVAGVRVTVNGDDAALNAGEWSKAVSLQPGWNNFYLALHDATGSIITNIEQGVVCEAGAMSVGGSLSGTVAWNDPSVVVYVNNNVVVPAGARLEVGPGVVVVLPAGMSITAMAGGVITVQGADENRAMFVPANPSVWGWLMAEGTNALLNLRYAEVVAGQVRVRNGGSLVIEDSVIRDLPDGREVIQSVSGAELTVRRTYMTRFSEGDSRDTPVLFEASLLEGFLVDGMDIKVTGSAPLVVRRSTFRNADPSNSNADAIDFGPGAGTVDSCIMHHFPDKGVSLGGAPGTVIRNSLIYRCGIGVSAYASSNVTIENTTIAKCTNGILFRDNPTRAVGVGSNLVVWDNITNVAVLQTSRLTVDYSDIQGTNYPGTGNISLDPLFVAPGTWDYRLGNGSPAKGTAGDEGDMGVRWPVGGIPSRPGQLVAVASGSDLVQLRWVDTAENEDGLVVERSADRVSWEAIGNAPANATTFTVVGPFPPIPVYYRVRATNDVGVSFYSNPAGIIAGTALELRIARNSPTSVVLSFDAAAGTSYTLQARDSLSVGSWTNWISIPAEPTARTWGVTNEIAGPQGYFRLVSP